MKVRFVITIVAVLLMASVADAQQTDRDRGIELYRVAKFPEAVALLENAVAADEKDRAAWMFLAGALVHTGKTDQAAEAFAKSNVRPTGAQPTYDRTVRITHKPRAAYTEDARRKMSSGKVRVAVEFRADGTIGFVFALPTTLDAGLVRQSVEAARGMKFEPAMKDGKPVTTINYAEYAFFTR